MWRFGGSAAALAMSLAVWVASPSAAATVSSQSGVVTYATGSGVTDTFAIDDRTAGAYRFFPALDNNTGQPGVAFSAGTGCTDDVFFSQPTVVCPAAGVTRFQADLLDGDDQMLMEASLPATVDLGSGDDEAQAGQGADQLSGGSGNDRIYGAGGADVIEGGTGDDVLLAYGFGGTPQPGSADVLRGQAGDDTLIALSSPADISGGTGVDTAIYDGTSDTVVSLDDLPNDGAGAISGANVHSDVENITTGPGDDKLTGSAGANRLEGGDGADQLVGGAGGDALLAGPGDDVVDALDGGADQIDCGTGTDRAIADAVDSVTGCEVVLHDADHDGVLSDADCKDADPAVHPGATDVPDDGIDQDCSGGDAVNLDRDGDGFARPSDCNDSNPLIHPGATEVPGNKVSEDCVGPPVPFPRLTSGVRNRWEYTKDWTRAIQLAVRDVPVGGRIQVQCSGRGCPAKRARFRSHGEKQIGILRALHHRRLRPGSIVEIRITASRHIGKVVRYRVRPNHKPAPQVRCLPPGTSRPARCATGT